MLNVKPVKKGTTTRMSFGKIEEVMEMPNLIEVQKNSYKWFLDTGLKEVFRDIAEITDYTGNWVLTFIDYRIDEKTKHTVQDSKSETFTTRITAECAPSRLPKVPTSDLSPTLQLSRA